MAQPVWVTPAGSLGTIPEGVFYQVPLQAYEPSVGESVYYRVIAGQLPLGVSCDPAGVIEGVPQATVDVKGVPAEVSRDVTSKFAVRAYTVITGTNVVNRIADRTFTLTVTGQDSPVFTTPPGTVGQYYDGSQIDPLQIEYTDTDPSDVVVVKLIAGSLPPGCTINNKGLITGYVIPNSPVDATAGFSRDEQGYDQYPFDFSTQSTGATYEFILEVTDGKGSDQRAFDMVVYARSELEASTTEITADNDFVTADVSPERTPFIITPVGSIGTVRNDNFFAFQFQGLDLDGDAFVYSAEGSLPPGLTLDPNSGWLYGYIPDLGQTENTYDFGVRVYKAGNPLIVSSIYNYNLSIIGTVDTTVIWLVPEFLGTIDNGATSTLYVAAENMSGIELLYRLESGSASLLPQGLTLLSSGDIAGRVSFDTFAIDGGTTTFDVGSRTGETTFDLLYTFTVNAYSTNGLVDVYKTFEIQVVRAYNEPYENLYIQAMPPFNDRTLINSLLTNTSIFPSDLIYRPTDPNFGVATNVIYDHAFGLTASTLADYVSSLDLNHYWKNLTLGNIETAQALDADGNVLYEVVYSRVVGGLSNNQGQSVSKEVTLPFPIQLADSSEITTVYPNSLQNMRDQVIDVVGQISNILPLWMLSKQSNGQVLGFTPAWVIAYTKPGKSGQVAYNIESQFTQSLNLVDFEVDRYELDRALTKNWDPTADSSQGAWEPAASLTTFDVSPHYNLYTPVTTGGTGYVVGDIIKILGADLNGVTGTNDAFLTVAQVSNTGAVELVFVNGTAALLTEGWTVIDYFGTNVIGTGSGAKFSLRTVAGVATTFDSNSMKFTAPVDMYGTGNEYDKYLVFPKRTILG